MMTCETVIFEGTMGKIDFTHIHTQKHMALDEQDRFMTPAAVLKWLYGLKFSVSTWFAERTASFARN